MKRICLYCGSSPRVNNGYLDLARDFGTALASRGLDLVYGGGRTGLMGAAADAVLAAGGRVIGVIPNALAEMEVAHAGLTELHRVDTMHERKAMMADLSDGFAALPGGLGTLDEWFEIWTWAQLGFHHKPIGLLNFEGFFDPLLTFLDHLVAEGFVRPEHRAMTVVERDVEALIDRLFGEP
ncbi:MAG: TIGR00730 family Rossman fold protein [Acidobacteriota bacterium]